MVSVEYAEALSEIDDIFNHLDIELLKKIPQKFKKFVSNNKSKDYLPAFDHSQKLNELPLHKKTKSILAMIYMNFLCNEEEKIEYTKMLKENSIRKEQEIKREYNNENIFKDKPQKIKEEPKVMEDSTSMIEYKVGFFSNIINRIKKAFNI